MNRSCRLQVSCARMKLAVNAPQVLAVDVRVDLRGGNIGVAKHLLHCAKVSATLEKVSCKGMSVSVWRHALRDAHLVNVFPKNLPGAHAGEWLTLGVEKKNSLPLS